MSQDVGVSRVKNVLVLGGGVGGTVAANLVAEELEGEIAAGQVRVRLVTDSDKHVYKPAFLYVAFGRSTPTDYERDQRSLLRPEVELVTGRITQVDTTQKRVYTEGGPEYEYDYLLIATGARVAPEETPGLEEGGEWFYTEDGARQLYRRLSSLTSGRVLVSVVGVPHMCPVAPLEITFMLDDFFRERGLRDKVEIMYTYPIGRLHSLVPVATWAGEEFEKRDIHSETFFNVESVDFMQKKIETIEGSHMPYDLLIAIPEHKSARFLEESGLTEGGWVPTDRHSLQVKGQNSVYALGDTTDLPVSKAGSVAHYQASVVAANVAARVRGERPARLYDGKTVCFIEAGFDKASFVQFDYAHPPQPLKPSKLIHWAKLAYNQSYWQTARGIL